MSPVGEERLLHMLCASTRRPCPTEGWESNTSQSLLPEAPISCLARRLRIAVTLLRLLDSRRGGISLTGTSCDGSSLRLLGSLRGSISLGGTSCWAFYWAPRRQCGSIGAHRQQLSSPPMLFRDREIGQTTSQRGDPLRVRTCLGEPPGAGSWVGGTPAAAIERRAVLLFDSYQQLSQGSAVPKLQASL